ncbi:MAG: hypothetical protein JWM47_4539 [Acidimicrobiales bacterium]|nr:hypothetical protein [Acidimicrobiales bacterium]
MPYFREDQANISLKVGTKVYPGSWKTFSGGDLASDNEKTRPGGMGDEVDVGAPASRSDVTLERQLTDVTAGWVPELEEQVGIGESLVNVQLLTAAKVATGQPKFPYAGTVKSVTLPDMGGGSAVAMLRVVISCHEKSPAGG